MLRTALTSLRYRTARLVLSCLAIGLGVAFVTGTLVMGASMNQAYFTSFAAGSANAWSPSPEERISVQISKPGRRGSAPRIPRWRLD